MPDIDTGFLSAAFPAPAAPRSRPSQDLAAAPAATARADRPAPVRVHDRLAHPAVARRATGAAWMLCAALLAAEFAWLTGDGAQDSLHGVQITAIALAAALVLATAVGGHALRLNAALRTEQRRRWQGAALDPLTGLSNRRGISEALVRELALARRIGQPLTLILIDIDGLRAINECAGVEVGDRIVRQVAERCRRTLRESDLCGRWDGDEMILLLPATDETGCRTLIDKLAAGIAADGVGDRKGGVWRVTVSAGAVIYTPSLRTDRRTGKPSALVAIAERAMNRAKVKGTGQAVIESTSALMD